MKTLNTAIKYSAITILTVVAFCVGSSQAHAELAVTCSAAASTNITPSTITWTANISTGTPSYIIKFDGTSYDLSGTQTGTWSVTGSDTSTARPYTSASREEVSLTVADSDGGVANLACPSVSVYEPLLIVSCSANPTTVTVGSSTTWTANIKGGLAPYTINWSGTDGLSGSGMNISKNYTSSGNKVASITSAGSSDGQVTSVSTDCSGSVTVNDLATTTPPVIPPLSGGGGYGGGYGGGGYGGGNATSTGTSTPGSSATTPSTVSTSGNSGSGTSTIGTSFWNRDLSIGSRGDDVSVLQQRLKSENLYCGQITGYFGPVTEEAVKEFQEKYGIIETGFVGPLTRSFLSSGISKYSTPIDCEAVLGALNLNGVATTTPLSVATSTNTNQNLTAAAVGSGLSTLWAIIWVIIILILGGIIWYLWLIWKRRKDDEEEKNKQGKNK